MMLLDRELQELGESARALSLAPGDVLVREGDEAHEVFYVRSGQLDAVTDGLRGEVLLGRVGAGELIGEIAVVTGRRRMATLRASEASVVFGIPRASFEQWMNNQREVADAVAAGVRERIDRARVASMIEALIGAGDPRCVQDILDAVEWRRVEAGEVVLREGDVSDAVYFVVSGRLVATQHQPDGSEQRLQEMGSGEIMGELGLIDGAPRSATVRALRDTTLARFSTASFETLIERHAGLALHVARSVVRRAGRPRSGARAASIAVAVTAPIDSEPFLQPFLAEIARFGTTFHLSSRRVDDMLNEVGIAQRHVEDVGVPRLSEFLHQADVENDHVIYEADAERDLTTWSRRCLRHADRVVLVVSAEPDADEERRLRQLVDELRQLEGVPWWVAVVHQRGSARPSASAALLNRYGAQEIIHVATGANTDITRLARLATGRGLGLVLSGGGARGFAHIGVIRALHEFGIAVDRVGGASIGAPIGAGVAMGLHPAELLETVSKQFRHLLDYTVPVVSVLKGARISKSIDESLGGMDIEDLWLGYYCVSTNLTASRLEIHDRGELALAVRASVAIPGVLPPVPYRGDLLVDGGVLANLPVEPMRAHPGIGTVMAVNVASATGPRARTDYGMSISGWQALRSRFGRQRSPYPSLAGVLMRTMIVGSLRDQPHGDDESGDLFLEIECKGVNMLAFDKVEPVAKIGYETARPIIEQWLATRTGKVL